MTTCTAADAAIPGTYTTLDTNGNVVGNTYTEDTSAINSYLVDSYTAAAATSAPTAAASASPLPTPGPNAATDMITIYIGEYSVPAFAGLVFPNLYEASATSGCFMMVLQQAAGGTAGQARHRDAAGSDNTFGVGNLANSASSYVATNVDAEALNSLTITNLTATTGAGTFALSNGTNGTLTITGSGTIVANQASTADRTRNPAYLRLRALMEREARNPFER